MKRAGLAILVLSLAAAPALSQALPRITALYPPGARTGATLDVSIRGGGLDGAREVLVDGPGLSAKLNPLDVKVDPADQKVFTAKCALCHEVRGPATISRTADQWVATVDRMIKEKGAPIEAADRQKIVNYVQAAARASAGLTARVTVAPDAATGRRELRIVAANGTSTVFPFQITAEPEALEVEPNNDLAKAPVVTLPATQSGQLAQGDVDCFAFEAKKDQRLVFNCSAFRLNQASQAFFFPVLYLYDPKGQELAKNTGYFSLDPLLDWTAPADGKYVVLVRDMLYRGSPSSIYRLSMGSLPYKTYVFPPGARRGTTAEVTVAGENMTSTTVPVSLPGDAPAGIRQVATPHGTFRFAAGEHPEYLEKPEGPQTVSLPVSINGRIEASGEEDKYTFTLAKENLGAFTFEVLAERLGSPLAARLTLRSAKGQALANSAGGSGARDPRLDYTFSQPGEYTLEVTGAGSKCGPDCVYRVSAGPSAPDFGLTVTPDNPNLGPGSSVYLSVRVTRRVGITGDIEVSFPNLPAGVTASRTVLRPDETQAFVILTAAPDAKPGTFTVIGAEGKATVNGQAVVRSAIPYEIYRIANNAQTAYRSTMVVTVGPETGWRVSLEPGQMKMSPESGPVTVTVRLDRKGVESDLPFAIVGVPQGVQAPRAILFKRGTSELTFTMTPTSGGIFAPRGANQPPAPSQFLLAVVNGREGEGMMMASPAVPVAVSIPAGQR
jgi:hypothetical protein